MALNFKNPALHTKSSTSKGIINAAKTALIKKNNQFANKATSDFISSIIWVQTNSKSVNTQTDVRGFKFS